MLSAVASAKADNLFDICPSTQVDKERELDFNFENRPYLFIDMETGEEVKAR
jgi:hypothetical protein